MHGSSAPYLISLSAPASSAGGTGAKGLGGFHIDDQLKMGWLFDRQIGGLGAFEDFVDVHGSLAKKIRIYSGVRHHKPGRHGNRRHAVLRASSAARLLGRLG
jgi:hypothetical protein